MKLLQGTCWGTCWGTHWEQQKKSTPHLTPQKEKAKQIKPLECMLTHLIGY